MMKGRHYSGVWLNDSAVGIPWLGTFLLLRSILEVPKILDGKCKPRTWHKSHMTHRFQVDKLRLHCYRRCSPVREGLDSYSEIDWW